MVAPVNALMNRQVPQNARTVENTSEGLFTMELRKKIRNLLHVKTHLLFRHYMEMGV